MKEEMIEKDTNIKIPWWLILLLVIIPICLYIGLSMPCGLNAIGGDEAAKIWLGFWATYIGAIASSLVVFYTYKTLKINKKLLKANTDQLNELKHQWEEEHTPELYAVIIKKPQGFYLQIENIGNYVARNVSFSINDVFYKENILNEITDKLKNAVKFNLKPNEVRQYLLCTPDSGHALKATQHPGIEYKDSLLINIDGINIELGKIAECYKKLKNINIQIQLHYNGNKERQYDLSIKSAIEVPITDTVNALRGINEKLGFGFGNTYINGKPYIPIQQSLNELIKNKLENNDTK